MSLYIDDSNWEQVKEEGEALGIYNAAFPRRSDVGGLEGVPVFAEYVPLLPESGWKSRIAAMTERGLFIGQRWKSNVELDYQNGLGFCWAKSLAQCEMAVRACEGQPFVQLMGEGLAECVRYENRGYYLDEALVYAAKWGIPSVATVPHLKIHKSQWKPEFADERQNFMPTEWWDLGGKDVWGETVTALLMGYGCYVGYDWWRHAVFLDMLRVGSNGKIEVHTPNTHGEGNDAWLAGSRAIPSMGSFVLRATTLGSGLLIAQYVHEQLLNAV